MPANPRMLRRYGPWPFVACLGALILLETQHSLHVLLANQTESKGALLSSRPPHTMSHEQKSEVPLLNKRPHCTRHVQALSLVAAHRSCQQGTWLSQQSPPLPFIFIVSLSSSSISCTLRDFAAHSMGSRHGSNKHKRS